MLANAQQHFHSPDLDKFVGTWTYNKAGKDLEITLYLTTVKIPKQNVTMDVLEGFHIYKVNGETVDNSKERSNKSLSSGSIEDRVKPNIATLVYFDELKHKSANAIITFIPGSPDKIRLSLANSEGPKVRRNGKPKFDKSFSLPESITLERKNN